MPPPSWIGTCSPTAIRGVIKDMIESETTGMPLSDAEIARRLMRQGLTVARRTGLLGDPLIYRLATPTNARPAASVEFRRTERIQIRWPVLGAVDSREARILGRDGVPLELLPKMSDLDDGGTRYFAVDLNLAPLTAGEYIVEVTATSAGKSESAHLAIRVGR